MSVASISASIKLQLGQFKADIAGAKSEMDKLNRKTQETAQQTENGTKRGFQGFKNWGSGVVGVAQGMNQVGSELTRNVSLPILGIGTAVTKTGITFDQKMAEVRAISGASGKDMQALEAKAREMGATTKFSATDAGDAMKYMAMAGWDNSQMVSGIAGIMDLASASGENLGTTSDIVTDALTAFGMSAGQSGGLADVLATASNNANTNVSLLGESFKYVAPVAGAMSYSAKDTATALGLMANAGIKGSMSGTALKTMITNLVNPTKQMKGQMDELGISMQNQDGSAKNLKEVMDELRSKFSGLSDEQKAQAGATIFGKEAMAGALAVINASEEDYQKLTKAMDGSEGSAKKMADTMSNTTQGRLLEMKSALEECALQLWDALKPAIESAIEWITKMAQSFQKLSPEQKANIVKWGLIVASIGPVLKIFANVILTAHKIYKAFKLIKTAIGLAETAFIAIGGVVSAPMLAIIAVVTAVGLIAYELWKHWDEVCGWLSKAWDGLKNFASESWGAIKDTVGGFISDTVESAKEKWSNLKDATSEKWNDMKDAVSNKASEIANSVSEKWASIKDKASEIWTGVKDSITGKVSEIATSVSEKWTSIKDTTTEIWTSIKEGIVGIFTGIRDFIVEKATSIWSSVTEKWTALKESTVSIFNSIMEVVKPIWDGLVNIIEVPMSLIRSIVLAGAMLINAGLDIAWAGIQMGAKIAWGYIKDHIVTPITEAFNKVKEVATAIGNAISEKWESIKTATSEKWGAVKTFVSDKFNATKNTVSSVAGAIHSKVSEKWNAVATATSEKWGQVKSYVTDKFNATKATAVSVAGAIHSKVSEKWNALASATSTKWGQVKSFVSDKFNATKSTVSSVAGAIHSNVSSKWSAISSATSSKWSSIKGSISSHMNSAKSAVGNATSTMHTGMSNKFNAIRDMASYRFQSIRNAIINPIVYAVDKVREYVGRITGFFSNMRLRIPTPHMPALPHFYLKTSSRSIMGKEITYPTGFGVNWYATGGIATGASVVGVGEAGDEAIVPLSNKGRMKPFASAVASMIDKKDSRTGGSGDSTPIVISGNNFTVREDADIEKIARKLFELEQREKRARGRGDK